eukprot:403342755
MIQEIPSDYQSSDEESYSSESEIERSEFIQRAKQLMASFAKLERNDLQIDQEIIESENDTKQYYDREDQRIYYKGKLVPEIPEYMNNIEDFALIIAENAQNILQSLTLVERDRLCALLPQKLAAKEQTQFLQQVIQGEKIGTFGKSPLENFGFKLEVGHFTKQFQQFKEYREELQRKNLKRKLVEDLKYVETIMAEERYAEENQLHALLNQLIQPTKSLSAGEDILSEDEDESSDSEFEEEKQIYNQIHAEFDELTSGYTTISSNKGEYQNYRRPINNMIQQQAASLSINRLTTLSSIQNLAASVQQNQEIGSKNAAGATVNSNEQSFNKQEPVKKSGGGQTQKGGGGTDSATKKKTGGGGGANKELSASDQKLLEQIMNTERFKNLKLQVHKNQVTLPKTSPEWIEIYRRQEEERYKHPTRPWIYYNEDATTSIVGPIVNIKKKNQQTNQKPRDHPMLYSGRPAIVTLLCLARDAASRLPDGVGTRADILELIKQSQWLKFEDTDATTLNNIVSGALDRLHYEDDPCVKYDSDRKLWLYLHKNRTIDYLDWQPQSYSERPNTMDFNSLNPYLGTNKEHIWHNSQHKETGEYVFNQLEAAQRQQQAENQNNENSESFGGISQSAQIQQQNFSSNQAITQSNPESQLGGSKIIVKLSFNQAEPVPSGKSTGKRHKTQSGKDFDNDDSTQKKRHKS